MKENYENNFLSTGYFNFECVKKKLSKRFQEIEFIEENVGKDYRHEHGKIYTIKLDSKIHPAMTVYPGKLVNQENLFYILSRLKTDSDLKYEIINDCLKSKTI